MTASTTASVDRTPKPCLHKQAQHQHGDRNTYVLDRCRCLPCASAASVYELARTKRNAYGRANYIDAQPTRDHVNRLTAAGIGLKTIVKRSGVPQGVLWKLMYGKKRADGTMVPSRRITRPTADRLAALDPADPTLLADGAKVTSIGTTRRLQALTCLGWSVGRLAAESGLDRQRLDSAINGRPVLVSTARAVTAMYERLSDQLAPATDHRTRISVSRAARRAQLAKWAPPIAWDDESLDDLTAEPFVGVDPVEDDVDELAVELVCDGQPMHLTGRDLEVAVDRLTERGLDAAAIAARCRSNQDTVRRIRDRVQQRARRAAEREQAA